MYKDVSLQDWNDWKWQMANRITRVEELEQVIQLNPEERKDILLLHAIGFVPPLKSMEFTEDTEGQEAKQSFRKTP